MGKVVVTFKLEEQIYSKLENVAKDEGRRVSEILREALIDWLEKNATYAPDFITSIKEQKSSGKSWAKISSLLLARYGISLNKEQLKSLSRAD